MRKITKFILISISYIIFGFFAILCCLIILPIISLTYAKEQRAVFYQRNVQRLMLIFLQMLIFFSIVKVEITGLDKLQTGNSELIIANHPSLLDVVFLIAMVPNLVCIVKSSLWKNIFMRGAVRGSGYILNDDPEHFMSQCATKINNKESILIFPEGTRTDKSFKLNKFKRGAANIVYNNDILIRPIVISMSPSFLTKEDKWYQMPEKTVQVKIRILDAFQLQSQQEENMSKMATIKKINQRLYDYYLKEVEIK